MSVFSRDLLIVKFGALGDVVRTSYLLPALAAKHPDARIWWLTSNPALELLRFNPHIYRLVTPTANFEQALAAEFEFAVSLDDEREVLDRLAQLKVGRVIGARLDGERRVYCDASAPWFDMGLISRHGKPHADELKRLNQREHHGFLEGMLGLQIGQPSFFNSPTLEAKTRGVFGPAFFHVGLNSGSGARWPSKQLRIAQAVELTRLLATARVGGLPVKVWLLGGHEEAARHAAICAAVPSERVVDPGHGQSIMEFAARVKALDFLITSDSLALHLGIAQGVRNVSFYAPTSAAEIGTFGTGTKVVSGTPDYCSYRPDADNSDLTAARIFAAFARFVGEQGKSVGPL